MRVIRFLGVLLLILSLMLLGADIMTTMEEGAGFATRSMDRFLEILTGGSLAAWVEATLPVSAASNVNFALGLPAWMIFGGIAIVMLLIGSIGRAEV